MQFHPCKQLISFPQLDVAYASERGERPRDLSIAADRFMSIDPAGGHTEGAK